MWYNCIKQKIEEMQEINYSHLEQMLDYRSEYFEERERIHKEKFENDKEYKRLMKMLEKLEDITIKVDIEV